MRFSIDYQRITLVNHNPGNMLVSNSSGEYRCEFEFDKTWDGFAKTAVFLVDDVESGDQPISVDNTCDIPVQILADGSKIRVGVYGVSKDIQRPTVYSEPFRVYLGAKPSKHILPIEKSFFTKALEVMAEIKQIAQSVRDDADAGKFKGERGEPGKTPIKGVDYWLPSEESKLNLALSLAQTNEEDIRVNEIDITDLKVNKDKVNASILSITQNLQTVKNIADSAMQTAKTTEEDTQLNKTDIILLKSRITELANDVAEIKKKLNIP